MKRDIWFLTVLSLSMLVGCQDDFDRGVPVTTVAGSAEAASFQGGQDWPQWRGIRRDGVSPEAGLGRSWPEGGPTEIWRRAIGTGYSGIVVSRNQLYTLDQNGDERLLAMSAENGREIWFLSFGGGFSNSQGDGPRGTPAADGELVFAVSGSGTLVAADRSTGRQVWKHDLPREFHSSSPNWGFATSPLVRGDLVLVEPGGQGGGSLAAFQKRDGELVWSSHSDPAGYSSPLAVEFEGQRQILFFTARHLLSVTPEQGRVLWQVSWTTSHDVNAATPIWIPPDRVFISSDYDGGGAVFEMGASGTPRQVWKNRKMRNHFSTSVYLNGFLYGFDNATLKCIDASDGSMKWRARGLGRGSLISADGMLIVLGERGQLALVEATPEAYNELSRAQVLRGKCWTSPTLAHGKLYLRNQEEIVCLDLLG